MHNNLHLHVNPISHMTLQAIGRHLGRALVPRSGSLLGGAHFLLALLFPLSGVLLAFAPWVSACGLDGRFEIVAALLVTAALLE